MKSYLYTSIFFVLLTIATNTIYANEITNHSFEAETENWTKTANTVLFSISTTDRKEASKSAEITYASTTSNGIKQQITSVTPDKTYKISAFIKSTTAKKAFIRIAWYQVGSTSQLKTDDSIVLDPETDWTPTDFIVTSPSNASSAEIRLLVSEGTAYFDTISIEEYNAPTPTLTPTAIISPTLLMTLSPSSSPTSTPTPSATVTPSTITSYNNIIISEAFVYPDAGMNEWIELYNNNSFPVNLTDWYIDDVADSGSLPKQIATIIPAYGYTVIDISTALFNNAGDSVRLLDTNKLLKDGFEYSVTQKNKSIGRASLNSNAICIQNPTKGGINGACIQVDLDYEEDLSITPTTSPQLLMSPPISVTVTKIQHHIAHKTYPTSTIVPVKTSQDNSRNAIIELPRQTATKVQSKRKFTAFLATSYSLLSFISVGVKMIIARH